MAANYYFDVSSAINFNNSLTNFMTANNIVDENTLIGYFDALGAPRNVPFPSSIKSQRFTLTRNPAIPIQGHQSYSMLSFVRENSANIRAKFAVDENIVFFGAIGGGKSHQLAEYALFLHCRRCLGLANSPRVLYIPSLKDTGAFTVDQKIASALKYCYPECTAALENPANIGWSRVEQLNHCRLTVPDAYVVGIFDDWNYFEIPESKAERLALSTFLNGAVTKSIIGLSYAGYISKSNFAERVRVECLPGLSDAEMAIWRTQAPYFAMFGGVANDGLVNGTLKDLTGYIPLILTTLCSYTNQVGNAQVAITDFATALERYDYDIELLRLGGANLAMQLNDFLNSCSNKRDHVQVMSFALADQPVTVYGFERLYHHGFFRYNVVTNTITPICGLIARYISHILLMYDKHLFREMFTDSWVKAALLSTNASVRDFAFERYVIGLIATGSRIVCDKELAGLVPRVVMFDGDYPQHITKETSGSSAILYVPFKWNLADVDCVLRITRETQHRTMRTNNHSHVSIQTVQIYGIQITTQLPSAHAATLQHFAGANPPCFRFRADGEVADHFLIWITPQSVRHNNNAQVVVDMSRVPHTPAQSALRLCALRNIRLGTAVHVGQFLYAIENAECRM